MARQFGYYDDWKIPILACAQCGWTGTFEQGAVAHFEELMDSSCPGCDTMLAIVPYPNVAESEQHWDQLSDEEKQAVSARKRFLNELPRLKADAIRANLGMQWEFGLRMQAEEKEEAQNCQDVLDRIEAQPVLSASERQGFMEEIATLAAEGRIAPVHARRLTRAVRRSRSL